MLLTEPPRVHRHRRVAIARAILAGRGTRRCRWRQIARHRARHGGRHTERVTGERATLRIEFPRWPLSLLQHHEGEKTTIPWYKKPNTRVRTMPPHTAATHGTRHQRPTNRTPNTRVRALPPHTAATHGARHQRPTGQAPRPGRSRSPRTPQPRRRRRAAHLPPPRRGPSRTAPSPAARSPRARPPRT